MSDPVVVFVLRMETDGKLSWSSTLPVPMLNLALDGVKRDLVNGRFTQPPSLVPPTNGEVQAVNRITS